MTEMGILMVWLKQGAPANGEENVSHGRERWGEQSLPAAARTECAPYHPGRTHYVRAKKRQGMKPCLCEN